MLKSKKNVFWEALIITIVIFLGGIFLGMLIENSNAARINNLYINSEIDLIDSTTFLQISENEEISCDTIKKANIEFANRIYEEAKLLEQYEAAGKLSESLALLHKKYDLLRTLMWMSNIKPLERCDNYNLIIYLYAYESEINLQKATQSVWSRILLEIRMQNENVLLIPIAGDQNLTSINALIQENNITQLPAIVINNKDILYEVTSAEDIQPFLN